MIRAAMVLAIAALLSAPAHASRSCLDKNEAARTWPSRVLAIDDDGSVAGWIGGAPQYDGHVWELHPLVVDEAMRGRGYGRTLVNDVECFAADNGALTMVLGTSDEVGRTTLTGQDLFLDVIAALRDLKPTGAHPLGFWQRVGYTVVGVIPDAEGPGKPTILLAKRISA
jgi:aminoglycoside 6'-N-acetyltransferase I